eukprot:683261-Amphidinium_carterae.2
MGIGAGVGGEPSRTEVANVGNDVCNLCGPEQWVFVLATGRSGSSSVSDMMDMVPFVDILGENDGFVSTMREMVWASKPQQNSAQQNNSLFCHVQGLLRSFLAFDTDSVLIAECLSMCAGEQCGGRQVRLRHVEGQRCDRDRSESGALHPDSARLCQQPSRTGLPVAIGGSYDENLQPSVMSARAIVDNVLSYMLLMCSVRSLAWTCLTTC